MKHKQPEHVLYIITKLELGGAQKVCLSLAQGLHDAGISTALISGAQGPLAQHAQEITETILLDSFKREISFFSFINEFRCFTQLIKHIRSYKKKYPNLIVHTHSTKAGILGRWAAFFAGVKNRVHTVHGYAFHQHQNMFVWLIIYTVELLTSFITTHYVCVSSEDVKIGIKLFPRFSQKHSIIRAAIDWNQFQPAQRTHWFPVTNEPFVFGTVSCFKPQKNLFDLLQAFSYVHQKNPNTRLELIGDGVLRTKMEQWIKKHNLTAAITLHGWQDAVAPIMATWHAFVLSSLWEGLPCAVVEARSLKLPVLCYNTGGIRDVIEQGKNGFLYPQKNWQQLAQGMLDLSNNKQLYEKLRNHTQDLYDFQTAHMVEQHIALYKSLSH